MDIDVVAENLTELLTNTVNMTSVFYDVFLNPTPMDVEIQQYDDNNELITVTIPNRAKDKQIAKDGEGSPEGAVDGPIGSAYVDTLTDNIYFKTSGSDAYGWTLVLNQRMAEDLMASYLEANGYLKYSDVTRTLSASSTHSQIPSAKAVYDFVEDEIQSYIGPPDEETNIFNLKNKITNCILRAPNGVMTFLGSTITVYSGLVLLIPGGRNDDGTLSNSVYTIETNLTFTYPESFASAKDIIFLTSEDDIIRIESEHVYKVQSYSNLSSLDDESNNIICYVKDDNEWYSTNDNGESWSTLSGVPIGYAIVDSEAGITDLVSYNTVRLLTEDDLEKVNNEVEVNINAISSDLNGKADKDLSNTDPSQTFITNISSNLVPDYENVIEVTAGAFGQWTQVLHDSFVCACGTDPYTETFWGYVSPDGGTTKYVVGRRYDDTNSNTQVTSFTFVVPKNWYFTCDAEEGGQYYIYPLKGVN